MNKEQYKLLSSRVRAAFTACVEARCAASFMTHRVAATVARRIGVKPIKLNRLAILNGDGHHDYLGDFGAGVILRRYQEKRARAAQRAVDVMLDTVKYLDGWRVETVEEVYS